MFEHRTEPLASRLAFVYRLARSFGLGLTIVFGSLAVGMLGYRTLEGQSWIDAFLNASMLLSGMGPISTPQTFTGKLFAGSYALYSGFIVILASGIVFAPFLHRALHHFHSQQKPG